MGFVKVENWVSPKEVGWVEQNKYCTSNLTK